MFLACFSQICADFSADLRRFLFSFISGVMKIWVYFICENLRAFYLR